MNLAALKTEIQTDAVGIGYAGKSHEDIARLLRTTVRPVNRETLGEGMLAASIPKAIYTALSANDKAWVSLLVSAGNIPLTPQLRQDLQELFPAGSATRAALVALMRRDGTRAEELGLSGVTESHVADALR